MSRPALLGRKRRTAVYDAIVAGAGPAGCAHALALAAQGATVLLAGPEPWHPPGALELVDARAQTDLAALGVLDRMAAVGRPSAGTVSRWGTTEFAFRSSILNPAGPGWIVGREAFDAMLLDVVRGVGIRVTRERLSRPARHASGWTAALSRSGQVVRGKRLVVATGHHGRRWLSAPQSPDRRPSTVAITGWFTDGIPGLGDRLLVDTGIAGWWYALGSPAGTRVTYCLLASRLPPPGRARAELAWRSAGSRTDWVPSLEVTESGAPRPAAVRLTTCAVPAGTADLVQRPGLLAIGDAALSVNPLSGHGVALALRGAVLAAHDPAGYQEWLRQTAMEHAAEETRLHAALIEASVGATDNRLGGPRLGRVGNA